MALKPFYNKKGHLGMTRAELLEKLNTPAGAEIIPFGTGYAGTFDTSAKGLKQGDKYYPYASPLIVLNLPVTRASDGTIGTTDNALVCINTFYDDQTSLYVNTMPEFNFALSNQEFTDLITSGTITIQLPLDFDGIRFMSNLTAPQINLNIGSGIIAPLRRFADDTTVYSNVLYHNSFGLVQLQFYYDPEYKTVNITLTTIVAP